MQAPRDEITQLAAGESTADALSRQRAHIHGSAPAEVHDVPVAINA
jgi:hypothetical protein